MQPYYETLSVDLGASTNLSFLDGSSNLNNNGEPSIGNSLTSIQNNPSNAQARHGIPLPPNYEENDVFQCGKCKQQYHNLQEFLQHKASQCSSIRRTQQHIALMHPTTMEGQAAVVSINNHSVAYDQIDHPLAIVSNTTGQNNELCKSNDNNVPSASMHLPPMTQNDIVCMPASDTMNRLLLNGDMLVHRNAAMLDEGSEQIDILTGNDGIDDLSQGNGLITSLLQQIPPFDPIHKVSEQAVISSETLSTCPSIQLTSNYITNANAVTNQSGDKLAEGQLENILSKLRDKSTDPIPSYSQPSSEHDTRQVDVTDEAANRDDPHVTRRRFACRYCKKTFSKNFDMHQHERSHTGEKPFQCIVCGRAFAQKSNVKKHMASHKVWLKGSSSVTQATDKGNENDGISIDDLSTFVCEYCGKSFSSYYKRKTHMKEHKDQQVYKCLKEGCASIFQDLDQFIAHVNSHNQGMTYRCHECHKVFKSLQDLGVHQYQVHLNSKKKGSQTKMYACSMCPSKFTHPTALREHMSSDSHSYVCRVCDATFTCERYRRKHYLLQHKEQDTSGNICGVCGKQLRSVYYLRLHMLIHTKELPYQCTKCDAAFNRKDKVKRHMLTHDPVKRFKCPLKSVLGCSKEFSRADKLKEHIITHSTFKKSFQCSYCSKKYRKHSCKVRHEKSHTTGRKCGGCDRWMEDEKAIKSHKCKKTSRKNRSSPGEEEPEHPDVHEEVQDTPNQLPPSS